MRANRAIVAAAGLIGGLALAAPAAKGQGAAIAYAPVIGNLPDGVILNVTPVVSADRRYVRMTLNPQFQTFISFETFNIPGAVTGGGNGNLGGFGNFGIGGGGLGGGGGLRSVGMGLDDAAAAFGAGPGLALGAGPEPAVAPRRSARPARYNPYAARSAARKRAK